MTHLLSYMRECSVVDIYCNPYCWKTERNKFRLFRDKAGTDILELQTTLVFHLVELWTVTEKERICLAWIVTRLSGLFFFFFFFFESKYTSKFHKDPNRLQYISLHTTIILLIISCSFLSNRQLYSVLYILSMNLKCPIFYSTPP